ncbi:MAG: anti-sigma factor [Rhizobiaceae bacterium]
MEGLLPEGSDDLLAAEYVLGVQPQSERAALAVRMRDDQAFAKLVADWEQRLAPLNDDYAPVALPPAIKAALDARLFPEQKAKSTGLWNSLAFWRTLTVGAFALTALMVAPMLLTPKPQTIAVAPIVAPMQADTGEVRFVAIYQPGSDEIRISRIKSEKAADKDYELWLVDDGGKPQSMGVLPDQAEVRIKVKPEYIAKINAGDAFAVSVEQTGGSPSGAPQGPIIAVGASSSI